MEKVCALVKLEKGKRRRCRRPDDEIRTLTPPDDARISGSLRSNSRPDLVISTAMKFKGNPYIVSKGCERHSTSANVPDKLRHLDAQSCYLGRRARDALGEICLFRWLSLLDIISMSSCIVRRDFRSTSNLESARGMS